MAASHPALSLLLPELVPSLAHYPALEQLSYRRGQDGLLLGEAYMLDS